MEVTGKIKMIDQTKEVGSAGFKKEMLLLQQTNNIHNIFWFSLFRTNVIC